MLAHTPLQTDFPDPTTSLVKIYRVILLLAVRTPSLMLVLADMPPPEDIEEHAVNASNAHNPINIF